MLSKILFYSRDVFSFIFRKKTFFPRSPKTAIHVGKKYSPSSQQSIIRSIEADLAKFPQLYRLFLISYFSRGFPNFQKTFCNSTEAFIALMCVYKNCESVGSYSFDFKNINIETVMSFILKNNKLNYISVLFEKRFYSIVSYCLEKKLYAILNHQFSKKIYDYISSTIVAQSLFRVSDRKVATEIFISEATSDDNRFVMDTMNFIRRNRENILQNCDIFELDHPFTIYIYHELFQFPSTFTSKNRQNILRKCLENCEKGTKTYCYLLQRYIQEFNGSKNYKEINSEYSDPVLNIFLSACDEDEYVKNFMIKKLENYIHSNYE